MRFASLAVVLLLVLALPVAARAQTIVVDTDLDVADPPFVGDLPCGSGTIDDLPGEDGRVSLREAIVAANNTAGPQRIEFAPALAGATITVDFDGPDEDELPEPLPLVCGGETTIDGDVDADGSADVTLAGVPALPPFSGAIVLFSSGNTIRGLRVRGFSVGLGAVHIAAFAGGESFADNTIAANVVEAEVTCIFVQGGSFDDSGLAGTVRATVVADNQVSAAANGIVVLTGDAAGSSVRGTRILRNRVVDNRTFGIALQASLTAAGREALVDDTVVADNEVGANQGTGITAFSVLGAMNAITGLTIADNFVVGNGVGVAVTAGVCGGSENRMEALIEGNYVTGGLIAGGGSNFGCAGAPPAARLNRIDVRLAGNRVDEPAGNGLVVVGGSFGGSENHVFAEIEGNQVRALTGIAVSGGNGGAPGAARPANGNSVAATVRGNAVGNSGAGIVLTGGSSGEASDNTVAAVVEENAACKSFLADVQCYGGLPALPGFAPNQGSGNRVEVRIAANEATAIASAAGTAGNVCEAEVSGNEPCRDGDVNCDRRINAADLLSAAELIGLGETSPCALDAEIPQIASAIFDG